MDSTDDGINPTVSLDTSFPLGNMAEKHPGYACTVGWHRALLRSLASVPRLSARHLSWGTLGLSPSVNELAPSEIKFEHATGNRLARRQQE